MTLLAVTFFLLMSLGVPIAFAIGIAGFSFFARFSACTASDQ